MNTIEKMMSHIMGLKERIGHFELVMSYDDTARPEVRCVVKLYASEHGHTEFFRGASFVDSLMTAHEYLLTNAENLYMNTYSEVVAETLFTMDEEGQYNSVKELQAVDQSRRYQEEPCQSVKDLTAKHVKQVLLRCGGNRRKASKMLGISERTLYRMIKTW